MRLVQVQARDTTTPSAEWLAGGILSANHLTATSAHDARGWPGEQLGTARIPENNTLLGVHHKDAIYGTKHQIGERRHGNVGSILTLGRIPPFIRPGNWMNSGSVA